MFLLDYLPAFLIVLFMSFILVRLLVLISRGGMAKKEYEKMMRNNREH